MAPFTAEHVSELVASVVSLSNALPAQAAAAGPWWQATVHESLQQGK